MKRLGFRNPMLKSVRQPDRNDPIKGHVKKKISSLLNAEDIFLSFSPTV